MVYIECYRVGWWMSGNGFWQELFASSFLVCGVVRSGFAVRFLSWAGGAVPGGLQWMCEVLFIHVAFRVDRAVENCRTFGQVCVLGVGWA